MNGYKKMNFARELRSPREIRLMRKAGLMVWQAHQAAYQILRPGVTTAELNDAVATVFKNNNAEPLFLNYPGTVPFPADTCISVNEALVHGIPDSRVIHDGDIVSLDTGCRINGWCGDAAFTHAVGEVSKTAKKLLKVTYEALNLAIELMASAKKWSEVAREMGRLVDEANFFVVDQMVGHGIGKELHESPSVPNCWDDTERAGDFELRPGVVIAVEPMVMVGTKELVCLQDEWTMVSEDGSLAAHFEHTLAITKDGVVPLTGPPNDEEAQDLPDWLQDQSKWLVW